MWQKRFLPLETKNSSHATPQRRNVKSNAKPNPWFLRFGFRRVVASSREVGFAQFRSVGTLKEK
jgi:hypothetical protein